MVERRAPQQAIDTAAIEKVSALEARMDGHDDLCAERLANLRADIVGVKDGIKQLNDDAKRAIDSLSGKQESYHKTNADALKTLTSGLTELTAKFAGTQGERSGLSDALSGVLKIMPIILSTATLIFIMFGRHP